MPKLCVWWCLYEVEELDEKKYTARERLGTTARNTLRQLWNQLEPTAGRPAIIRANVTIEVPIDEGPRERPLDADREVLDTCQLFTNTGSKNLLVTADTGLSLRAVAAGVRVVRMPERYLRKKGEE
jgi:hypothetical protein